MKLSHKIALGFWFFIALSVTISDLAWPATVYVKAPVGVQFSPRGGCTEAIVEAISNARSEILVQGYSFTSAEIISALAAARERGVSVQIILDKGQDAARYAALRKNLPAMFDRVHAIAHNKVMIIDQLIVITGSFNFTKNAEQSNAENLLVIPDSGLAGEYIRNWKIHHQHSK